MSNTIYLSVPNDLHNFIWIYFYFSYSINYWEKIQKYTNLDDNFWHKIDTIYVVKSTQSNPSLTERDALATAVSRHTLWPKNYYSLFKYKEGRRSF